MRKIICIVLPMCMIVATLSACKDKEPVTSVSEVVNVSDVSENDVTTASTEPIVIDLSEPTVAEEDKYIFEYDREESMEDYLADKVVIQGTGAAHHNATSINADTEIVGGTDGNKTWVYVSYDGPSMQELAFERAKDRSTACKDDYGANKYNMVDSYKYNISTGKFGNNGVLTFLDARATVQCYAFQSIEAIRLDKLSTYALDYAIHSNDNPQVPCTEECVLGVGITDWQTKYYDWYKDLSIGENGQLLCDIEEKTNLGNGTYTEFWIESSGMYKAFLIVQHGKDVYVLIGTSTSNDNLRLELVAAADRCIYTF